MEPIYRQLVCVKALGGKRPLWHARHPDYPRIVGAGNTGDNAIKDWQKMRVAAMKNGLSLTA